MNPVTDDTVIDIARRWPRPEPKPAPRQRVDAVALLSRIIRTDGGGQAEINLQIGGEVLDLLV